MQTLQPITPNCTHHLNDGSTTSLAKQDWKSFPTCWVWAVPVSLATTRGISKLDLFSSSYLDVSVHWLASTGLIYSTQSNRV